LEGIEETSFILDVNRAEVGSESFAIEGGALVNWSSPGSAVHVGERVRVSGEVTLALGRVNPGVSSYEDYLRLRDVHIRLTARGPGAIERIGSAPIGSLGYWASRWRAAQARVFRGAAPESVLPFVWAVWLGDQGFLADSEYQSYVRSGTAHILSVSGVHAAIMFASASFLLRLLNVPPRLRAAPIILSMMLYAFMTGASVATVRAAMMVCVYVAADFFDRERDAPTALALAGIAFLAWDSDLLFDLGFQLSFLSVASMLLFSDRIDTILGCVWQPVRPAISSTLAVQLLPLPVAARHFHFIPLAATLANLLIIPLVAAALWLCVLTALAGAVSLTLATAFGHTLWLVVRAIQWIAALFAAANWLAPTVTSPTLLGLGLWWFGSGALATALHAAPRRRRFWAFAAVSFTASILFWEPWRHHAEIAFLDVGHGDAAVVRTRAGATMLVDGGDRSEFVDNGERIVAPFLWSRGVTRVDAVVASHADRDHMGGLIFILEHFDIGVVYLSPRDSGRDLEHELIQVCQRRDIPVRRVQRGEKLELEGATVEVLHPAAEWAAARSINDASIVLRVRWEGQTVLFTGDIEESAESVLSQADCRADVLKVPHHGADTSSTLPFLRAVAPRVAVASTGATGRRVLDTAIAERYERLDIAFYRTDRDGGIEIQVDGDGPFLSRARVERGYPLPHPR
jgi:competence protein ComEC